MRKYFLNKGLVHFMKEATLELAKFDSTKIGVWVIEQTTGIKII